MKELIKKLEKETESLKEQYLNKTKEWAKDQYQTLIKRAEWKDEDWCRFMGIEPETKKDGRKGFPRGFYNTKESATLDRHKKESDRAFWTSEESFISNRLKKAETHYHSSIEKLAHRIEDKNIDVENVNMETSHIGVNIETVITDGEKTVRAWTTLAFGEVQKPHYRYYVK